jgi:hypothetical protein
LLSDHGVIQITIEMYGEQREPSWILPNLRYFAKFYQADRYTVGKRCYINAFKTKMIQIALKYRQFCSFKVVHAGIIFYRHSGMTTQFLVCFPITEADYDQANF